MKFRNPKFFRSFYNIAAFFALSCNGVLIASAPADAQDYLRDYAHKQQVVGVQGTHLTLNGAAWMSRGVMIRAFVSTHEWLSNPANGETSTAPAAAAYGSAAQVAALQNYGADTIRFPVSQYYLASGQNPASAPSAYAQIVVSAIKTARENGFLVLIQMQDEISSGDPDYASHFMSNSDTVSAWRFLDKFFKDDQGIMYELYNEPNIQQSAAGWNLWLNGDPNGTSQVMPHAVGMQSMINVLRADGSTNVFVLDGVHLASTLEGLTPPNDSLNSLVYAVHPYQHGSTDSTQWPAQFEKPSKTYPVWADEWGGLAGSTLMLGDLPGYHIAVKLLNHLRKHGIPVCTLAFDVPNFTTTGTVDTATAPAYTPTNYDNYSTTAKGVDSGLLTRALFQSQYGRRIDEADGVTH